MSKPLDKLLELLDLEQIELDIFRGRSPDEKVQRVFGGQVAGQALVAAGRADSTGRSPRPSVLVSSRSPLRSQGAHQSQPPLTAARDGPRPGRRPASVPAAFCHRR
jgi:hypothetical protein